MDVDYNEQEVWEDTYEQDSEELADSESQDDSYDPDDPETWPEINAENGFRIQHARRDEGNEPLRKKVKFIDLDELNDEDAVLIFVGSKENKAQFKVPKAAVEEKSGHYRTFKRYGDGSLKLSKVKPNNFEAYAYWLRTSKINYDSMPIDEDVPSGLKPTWLALVKLWELGEIMEDIELCNKLTDMIINRFEPSPSLAQGVPKRESSQDFYSALEYVMKSDQDIVRLRRLMEDLFFTGQNSGIAYDASKDCLSKKTLLVFVNRWVRGQKPTQIPLDKKGRDEAKVRYHKTGVLGGSPIFIYDP